MKFAHPELFLLLAIVPLLAVAAILTARGRGRKWQRLVAERLRPLLVRERPAARRWIAFAVLLSGFVLLIAALAAPNAGYREATETIRGRNILLAVDVSRSMLASQSSHAAGDSTSRLAAARAAALELLDRFPNDRVGLIAFSGVAWLQAPLTIDHDALREAFRQLEFQDTRTEWIPRGGTDLANAVQLANRTFRETGQRNNALVVLSDGEAHSGDLENAAEDADAAGVTIFTVGFGTDEGAFIPDPQARDGKLHDREGNLVLTRLESDSLSLLARRTGGFYTTATGRHLAANLEVAVQRLDRFEMEGRKRRIAIPRFQWFLVPSMVLFLVGMLLHTSWRPRRQATALAAILLVFGPAGRSEAGLIPRTKAERAFEDGKYQRALDLFEAEVAKARGERKARLQLGEAAAAYRLRDLARASQAYSGALLSDRRAAQEQAHFGLGNTQFYRGLEVLDRTGSDQPAASPSIETTALFWRDAIAHFDAVLALDPDNTRARENRDHVAKRLEDLLKEKAKQTPPVAEEPPRAAPPEAGEKTEPDAENDPERSGPSPPGDQTGAPDSPPEGSEDPGSESSAPPEPENAAPATPDLSPRAGESPEEYARRVLEENADFQGRPVPLRLRHLSRPEKDW